MSNERVHTPRGQDPVRDGREGARGHVDDQDARRASREAAGPGVPVSDVSPVLPDVAGRTAYMRGYRKRNPDVQLRGYARLNQRRRALAALALRHPEEYLELLNEEIERDG